MMNPARVALAAGLMLASSAAVAADSVAPAGVALSGAAAWEAIKGNTILGKVAGEDFSDYFDPGGAVRHVDGNGQSAGTWAVQGDKVCLDFPEDDERSCLSFEVTGATGTAVDDAGTPLRITVEPGNTKGL